MPQQARLQPSLTHQIGASLEYIWIFVSQRARHYALALVRSAPKNRRQQLMRYWGSWYVFANFQCYQNSAESMWLEYENASQLASGEAEDGMLGRVVRGGVLEQPATAVQSLRAQEFELQYLRQQLHLRDENFGQLRAVLAESESQVAAMQEKLSSEMAVSELDENVALDRVAES